MVNIPLHLDTPLQKVTMDAVNEVVGGEVPPYTHYTPAVNPAVNFLYAGAVKYFFLTMGQFKLQGDHESKNIFYFK